jgi:hypothetical protein
MNSARRTLRQWNWNRVSVQQFESLGIGGRLHAVAVCALAVPLPRLFVEDRVLYWHDASLDSVRRILQNFKGAFIAFNSLVDLVDKSASLEQRRAKIVATFVFHDQRLRY